MRALALLSLTVLLGCSANGGTSGFGGGGADGSSTTSATGSGGAGGAGSTSGAGGDLNIGGSGGGEAIDAEVFAHSPTTLFKLDPITKAVALVNDFSGCGGEVIDIAIDKDGVMYGTTFFGLNKIDKATAACTQVASGSYPNSLSFVPQGTLDPNEEALVGYVGSSYVRIDKTTGEIQTIGQIGGGYSSSGDIVSVIGGGTYLTVTGPNCGDCIIEVDPKTGALVKPIGPLGHSKVYGLAFWGGLAYGFDEFGLLFEVNLTTALTTNIPVSNPPPGLKFWGAGSTTAAPLETPQ